MAFVSLPLMVNPILKSSLAKVVSTGNVTTPLGVAERATTVAYKGDELLRLYLLFIIHYFFITFVDSMDCDNRATISWTSTFEDSINKPPVCLQVS